jgi:hypothetical protein
MSDEGLTGEKNFSSLKRISTLSSYLISLIISVFCTYLDFLRSISIYSLAFLTKASFFAGEKSFPSLFQKFDFFT